MAIIDNKFTEKFAALPEEAKLYYASELSGQAILDLAEEYNVASDDVYALVFLAVNSDFDLKLLQDRIKTFNITGINLKRFWFDFLGRLLLPIASYVEKKDDADTSVYIELVKAGGKPDDYKVWFDGLDLLIDQKNGEELDGIMEKFEEDLDEKEEREYVLDLLSGSIIDILKTKSFSASSALNSGFIYLLFNSEGFKEEASRTILASRELISKKNITIEGKELAPSIANWIKDFIKINGSDMFSEITLAQYLDSSANASKLSPADKSFLSGVLHLYRNVTFFPESMEGLLPEKWQIFPFELPEDSLLKKIKLENKIENKQVEKSEKEEEKSQVILDAEKEFLSGISMLSEALKNYKSDSLEYKAIEEEIRRLKVKKS